MKHKCAGCGIQLQTIAINLPGYIPALSVVDTTGLEAKEVLTPGEVKALLKTKTTVCQRCWNLKQGKELPLPLKTNLAQFQSLNKTKGTVVYVLDAFDLPASLIPNLETIIGSGHRLIVLINKIDLLPKIITVNWLASWVKSQVDASKIMGVSAKTGEGIYEFVEELRAPILANDPIYIVGATNVGKSALFNTLSSLAGSPGSVTVTEFAGTTQQPIEMSLETLKPLLKSCDIDAGSSKSQIIDTAGVMSPFKWSTLLTRDEIKVITPLNEIKPKKETLGAGKSVMMGGLARLDCTHSMGDISLSFYGSSKLPFQKLSSSQVESHYARFGGLKECWPPIGKQRASLFWPQKHVLDITVTSKRMPVLFLSGLGWILFRPSPLLMSFKESLATFKLHSFNTQGMVSTSLPYPPLTPLKKPVKK